MFRITAAERSVCAQTSYFPRLPRVFMRNEPKSRASIYPGFIGIELMLRVLIRGNYFLGQTGNSRLSFIMTGSSMHAIFKGRGDVQ